MSSTLGGHGSSRHNKDLYSRKEFPDKGSEGRFGRLFPISESGDDDESLRPHPSPRFDLERLGEFGGPMTLADGAEGQQDSHSPAGVTFLGQFVDHDITLDVQSKFEKPEINVSLENARTPNLDLDCVYGGGREASPHLYKGPYLIEGELTKPEDAAKTADLPRNTENRAIIGDPRNDENVMVAQVQSAFLRFHNRCVDVLFENDKSLSDEELFEQARDTTTHFYHRVVLEDMLYRMVGFEMIQDISVRGRKYYFPKGFWKKNRIPEKPFMPVEFSVAAYRFGHSQIRDTYKLNAAIDPIAVFLPRSEDPDDQTPTLRGFDKLPENYRLDWNNFFNIPGSDKSPASAFKVDPFLPKPLLELPTGIVGEGDPVVSLASRNLVRGRTFRLPSGESIARRMQSDGNLVGHDEDSNRILDLSDPETATHPAIRDLMKKLRTSYAMTETPLWLYILMEAAEFGDGFDPDTRGSGGGDRLGPVGGRIVAEVLMGLLDHYRDMSGKGLDYSPKVPYNLSSTVDTKKVTIVETVYGPRMTMGSFVQFAYGEALSYHALERNQVSA
ncbi:MAG: hypothetical protein KTR32_02435 [Granulosicoccus sp.]|nr:hypothetical protein [Granulosicoccus sp.]